MVSWSGVGRWTLSLPSLIAGLQQPPFEWKGCGRLGEVWFQHRDLSSQSQADSGIQVRIGGCGTVCAGSRQWRRSHSGDRYGREDQSTADAGEKEMQRRAGWGLDFRGRKLPLWTRWIGWAATGAWEVSDSWECATRAYAPSHTWEVSISAATDCWAGPTRRFWSGSLSSVLLSLRNLSPHSMMVYSWPKPHVDPADAVIYAPAGNCSAVPCKNSGIAAMIAVRASQLRSRAKSTSNPAPRLTWHSSQPGEVRRPQ